MRPRNLIVGLGGRRHRRLAMACQYRVLLVDHRLLPESPFPTLTKPVTGRNGLGEEAG